jgi:hypothetical protein
MPYPKDTNSNFNIPIMRIDAIWDSKTVEVPTRNIRKRKKITQTTLDLKTKDIHETHKFIKVKEDFNGLHLPPQ